MAGTPIGKIDCDISATNANGSQEQFKNLYDFFQQMVAAGYATRIALQYGIGPGPGFVPGTGTDYHDGANPFEENAFAVFRMDGAASGNTASDRDGVTLPDFDYYVLIQWADATSFGTSPGNPGKANNVTGIDGSSIAIAVREDGGNPWNGTTNNDGTDLKGATVWVGGVSTVHVFPTSNELDSAPSVTNKEDTRNWYDGSTSTSRIHIIGDADSFVLMADVSDDGTYSVSYYGVYIPTTGLTPPIPLVCVSSSQAIVWPSGTGTGWGSLTTTSNQGGVLGAHISEGMAWLSVGFDVKGVLEDAIQPNAELATAELDAVPIRVSIIGRGESPMGRSWRAGYVGDLDTNVMQAVDNIASEQTNAALTRAYFGSNTTTNPKHSVPWDGVTTPGSTLTRAGVTF